MILLLFMFFIFLWIEFCVCIEFVNQVKCVAFYSNMADVYVASLGILNVESIIWCWVHCNAVVSERYIIVQAFKLSWVCWKCIYVVSAAYGAWWILSRRMKMHIYMIRFCSFFAWVECITTIPIHPFQTTLLFFYVKVFVIFL